MFSSGAIMPTPCTPTPDSLQSMGEMPRMFSTRIGYRVISWVRLQHEARQLSKHEELHQPHLLLLPRSITCETGGKARMDELCQWHFLPKVGMASQKDLFSASHVGVKMVK